MPLFSNEMRDNNQNYPSQRMPKTQAYPKVHKIIINSKDVNSGDLLNGYYNVRLSHSINSDRCMFILDSFLVDETAENNGLLIHPYNIHISELSQPNSYSTKTKSNTDVVVSLKGRDYNNYANLQSCGSPIVQRGFFDNALWNIYFTSDIDPLTDTNFNGDWTMVIYVVELDDF